MINERLGTALDKIYDAVNAGIDAQMTPAEFKEQIATAWRNLLANDIASARKELSE